MLNIETITVPIDPSKMNFSKYGDVVLGDPMRYVVPFEFSNGLFAYIIKPKLDALMSEYNVLGVYRTGGGGYLEDVKLFNSKLIHGELFYCFLDEDAEHFKDKSFLEKFYSRKEFKKIKGLFDFSNDYNIIGNYCIYENRNPLCVIVYNGRKFGNTLCPHFEFKSVCDAYFKSDFIPPNSVYEYGILNLAMRKQTLFIESNDLDKEDVLKLQFSLF